MITFQYLMWFKRCTGKAFGGYMWLIWLYKHVTPLRLLKKSGNTMAVDPGIICFRHCTSESIFCKGVLEVCPICQSHILDYAIEPFLVPYPYTNATYHPAAIIVRPSQGTFINDYDVFKDLHIGITDSNGVIYEYDKQGIILNDRSKWTSCIAFKITPNSWDYHWDATVKNMLESAKWKSENYDETAMNCFDFVIEFLNNLQYMNIRFENKANFCIDFLLSKIHDAIKYNCIFKKLENHDFFIS